MQYIPQKNIKSATAAFADSLLIVCYELSYPHFMERRGSLYFSSEHTACSPEANASLTKFCMGLYKRACEKHFVFHTPFIMLSPMK